MIKNQSKHKIFLCFSIINIPLTIFAVIISFIIPDIYIGINAYLKAQAHGQDIITLFIVVPLMTVTLILFLKGSLKSEILFIGTNVYNFYTYLTYALGGYNHLFLVYISIASVSFYTILIYLITYDYNSIEKYYRIDKLFKSVGIINILIGSVLSILWYSHLLLALINNDLPMIVKLSGWTVIYAMDLLFIAPFFVISGILLLMRKPIGYILSGIILVKGLTIGLAVLSMNYFQYKEGVPLTSVLPVIVVLLALSTIDFVFYIKSIVTNISTT
jgi:hypothetical protein